VACSERRKEIKRRRHRRVQIAKLKVKAAKATTQDQKDVIIRKIRSLTPGGDEIIAKLGLN